MKVKQTYITDYFKIVKKRKICGYNKLSNSWHCMICGVDMGKHNPRQYCRKTYCPEQDYESEF